MGTRSARSRSSTAAAADVAAEFRVRIWADPRQTTGIHKHAHRVSSVKASCSRKPPFWTKEKGYLLYLASEEMASGPCRPVSWMDLLEDLPELRARSSRRVALNAEGPRPAPVLHLIPATGLFAGGQNPRAFASAGGCAAGGPWSWQGNLEMKPEECVDRNTRLSLAYSIHHLGRRSLKTSQPSLAIGRALNGLASMRAPFNLAAAPHALRCYTVCIPRAPKR